MGPSLATTPESRWPLKSGGKTLTAPSCPDLVPTWAGVVGERGAGQVCRTPQVLVCASAPRGCPGSCPCPLPRGGTLRACKGPQGCPHLLVGSCLKENGAALPMGPQLCCLSLLMPPRPHPGAQMAQDQLQTSMGPLGLKGEPLGVGGPEQRLPGSWAPLGSRVQESCLCWPWEVVTASHPFASGKAGEGQVQNPPLPRGPHPPGRDKDRPGQIL